MFARSKAPVAGFIPRVLLAECPEDAEAVMTVVT
jgi:hypothetical protein